MTAGLETPIAAGSGPSLFGIAKAIGTKIRDSAEQAKEEKEKANKEGVEVKKGSLFTKSLKNNLNPFKSKKSKTKWAKDFSWNQPKPKDPSTETKGGGRTKGGGSGAKKLKNFITSAFGLLLKDTTVMVGKLSSISDLTGKVYSANKLAAGSLTSINSLLQEQTDIKRDMLEQAKYARMEKQMEKTVDSSGTSTPIGIGRKKGGGGEGSEGDGGPGGGGGLFGGIAGALDLADNLLDIGGHLRKTRLARKMRVAGKRGVKSAGNLAKNAKGFGAKFLGKAAGKEGLKVGAKAAAKTGGKAVAKGVGKALLKKVPLIGLIAGVGFGIERMMRGDWGGGLTEIASGAASTVPGFGTAASVALDAGLMAKDLNDPASMMPQQEKLAEGGVIPSGVYDNPTTGMLPPGSSVIPLNRNVGKEVVGQDSIDEMTATPIKAVGAAILGITDRMLKNTDSGIAGDMIRQDISRLSRDFGISNPLTTTSLGKGSFGKKAFGKEGEKYFAEVLKKSFADQGLDLSKKETATSPSGGGGGGGGTTPSGGGGGASEGSGSSSPEGAAAKAEPTTLQKLQQNVGFVNKQVDQGFFGGGVQTISGVTGTDKAGVKRVKMVDWGGQLSDKYYYDKTGRVFYIDPAQGQKSIREVNLAQLKTGLGDAGKFYRNLQTGQVVVTNNPPIGYYNYEKNGVVVSRRKQIDQYGNVVRAGDPNMNADGSGNTNTAEVKETVPLSALQGEEKTNFGTGLYGPDRDISRIKAESGASMPAGVVVSSRRGWRKDPHGGGKDLHEGTDISAPQGTKLYAFTDGKVLYKGVDGGYGNYIGWAEKNTGVGHFFGHLHSYGKNVQVGTEFKKGKILGTVGSTGKSTGPHLHWEMADNPADLGLPKGRGKRKDPLSRYSASSPFIGKPGPGDGVDSSTSGSDDSAMPNDSQVDGSNIAKIEDLDDIFNKVKEYATAVSESKKAPPTLPSITPSPSAPSNSATNTRPAGGGMDGRRGSGSSPSTRQSTAFIPVKAPQQVARNSGSTPGSLTPYSPPPVDIASTPHAINPFLFIDA